MISTIHPFFWHTKSRRYLTRALRIFLFSRRKTHEIKGTKSSIFRASAQSAKAHPFRCASPQNRNRFAGLQFCSLHVGTTWAFAPLLRTLLQSGQKTARSGDTRLTARCGRSARLREIHRLPLLRQVSARIPFSLRAAMLSRTSRVIFLTEFEFQSPVGDITPGTMQRGNIGKTRVLLQNKCRVRRTT